MQQMKTYEKKKKKRKRDRDRQTERERAREQTDVLMMIVRVEQRKSNYINKENGIMMIFCFASIE